MESTQELQHWGIKGQKWGIRRYQNPDGTLTEAGKKRYYYQNPDGSLTEAGKKDYMTAAKKGKLDVSKLSDNDLNMINSRFAREKTFKQNVSDYEKSTFKYKLKEAALERIKGSGGGKGKGKGGGGGSTIGKLLVAPITKAFADAFTSSNHGKGNGKDDDDEENRLADWKKYKEYKNNGHVWTAGFKWSKADKQNRERWENEGKRFVDTASKDWRTGDNRTSGSRTSDQYLLDNYRSTHKKTKPKPEPSVASKKWKKWDQTAERAGKSGLIISHSVLARYIITRSSNELYHWGIKGQKWGVRRFQNSDGTLTDAGKKRYLTRGEYREILRDAKKDKKAFLNEWKSEQSNTRNDNERQEVDAKYNRIASGMAKSRSVLEKNAGHFKKAEKFLHESEVLSRKADQLDDIISNRVKQLAVVKAEKMAQNKKVFGDALKSAKTEGLDSWWSKNHSNGNGDKFLEHVWDTQGKLLDRFYNERDNIRYSGGDWSTIQQKYSKQLASNLGLPQTDSTYYILENFFINGDD